MHFDTLAQATLDERAPADERRDATLEVYRQLQSEVTREYVDSLREEFLPMMMNPAFTAKAMRFEPYAYASALPKGHPRTHTSVLYLNEFGVIDRVDSRSRWLEKRGVSGFQLMKDMATNVDVISSIILTFIREILPWTRPERDEMPQGFRIARVDGEKVTKGEKAETDRIERFLLNGGDVDDYFRRQRLQRPDLSTFVTKMLWDTLSGDADPVEITRTNGGKPSGFHNVDFSTIRLCSESGYEGDDEIRAVQVLDGVPHVAFGYQDIIYETRNARTDIYSGGYGFAETEMVLRAATGYLNTVTYNLAGLDRNAMPRGVGTLIKPGMTDEQLEAARRQILLMLTGAGNRHKFPLLAAAEGPGFVWTKVDDFDDMFFARLTIFCIAIACAIYGKDPTTIGFDSFSTRNSSLSGKDTAEKIDLSHDKGKLPLLTHVEKLLTILVQLQNPRYRCQLVGLHPEDEKAKQERIVLSRTVDQVLALDGMDPHPDPLIGR